VAHLRLTPNPTLPILILHKDVNFVIVDKPAGIPSLALRHTETDTVANFLVSHFPETALAGSHALEAGLVHRLDTETSGLLLAALTPPAYATLREQFRLRSVGKTYLAIVEGLLQTNGHVASGLVPTGLRGQDMRVVAPGQGQEALTTYVPLAILPAHTLVRVTIATGVRHQIRAHLAALGHPIVGDNHYGTVRQTGAQRLCLHAETLCFRHPTTGQEMKFTSTLPHDLSTTLQTLRKQNRHREQKQQTSSQSNYKGRVSGRD
jgi:23S rRNA pseudouridine1911/1915/1917 synthase